MILCDQSVDNGDAFFILTYRKVRVLERERENGGWGFIKDDYSFYSFYSFFFFLLFTIRIGYFSINVFGVNKIT